MLEEQQLTSNTQEAWDYNPQQNEQVAQETADQLQPSIEPGQDPSQQLAATQSPEPVIPEAQYKSLQAGYTQTRQELMDLSRRNQQLTDMLIQRQQPTQQAEKPLNIWDSSEEEITARLNKDFKGTMRSMIQTEAELLADKKLAGVREDLVATQAILNEQRLNASISSLQHRYGAVPEYRQLMEKAVDYVTGPGAADARRNPAEALERQFKFEFYSAAERNPALMANVRQNVQAQNNQLEADKRMAAPMTTRSNVSQPPHQPLSNPQGQPTQSQIARQIATYGDDNFWNGGRQFNASFQEY